MTPRSQVSFRELLKENREYRALFLSQLTGQAGDWLNLLALLQIATNTSSPALVVALVLGIHYEAAFVLGPLAGILADRFNRRSLLITLDVLRIPVVLGFLFVESATSIVLLATLQYSLGAIFEPTRQALTQSITEAGAQRSAANSLGTAVYGATGGLGMLIGGILVATSGTAACFVVDAVTFAASAFFLLGISRASGVAQVTAGSDAEQSRGWGEVWRLIKADPRLRRTLLIRPILALPGGAYWVLGIRIAQGPLAAGEDGAISNAVINATMFIGAVIAGNLMNRHFTREQRLPTAVGWFQLIRILLMTALGLTIFVGSLWLPAGIAAAALCMLGLTVSGAMMYTAAIQLLKELVPLHMHGRVFALDIGFMNLLFGASALAVGLVADNTDLSYLTLLGSLSLIMVPIWLLWLPASKGWEWPEDSSEHDQ